jgi:glycerate 2-kinase
VAAPPTPSPPSTVLREHALCIWHAGVEAVRSERLVKQAVRVEGRWLHVGDERIDLTPIRRIAVVGAGKASAGMAAAIEEILLAPTNAAKIDLIGWVNVPADCVRPLRHVHLHAARPAGLNEPTAEGVAGSVEMLRIVGSLSPDDLCLCLLSGGGSALLPAPVEGITLADKQQVTRHLSAAGANIRELNTVRKQLSRIKGGGLPRACRAGRLITLVISDVLGDPLDIIASGPTVPDTSTPAEALAVLERFGARETGVPPRVFEYLERRMASGGQLLASGGRQPPDGGGHFAVNPSGGLRPPLAEHVIIGNNAAAVEAAGDEAQRLGYCCVLDAAQTLEGQAEDVGGRLAQTALRMRDQGGPNCLISGGEPVVCLVEASRRGLGGRNQQLVLAALEILAGDGMRNIALHNIALLSGGTDGEDGPTDAAGAVIDEHVLAKAQALGLDLADHLARNDAYHFFEPLDALIKTGPTHTNVCDLRVVVVDQCRA